MTADDGSWPGGAAIPRLKVSPAQPAAMANRESSSSLLLSTLAGAVLGAAGLAWWLLSETEKRQQRQRRERNLQLSRLSSGDGDEVDTSRRPVLDSELQDKVQQLNRAIDDVRRQLEGLGSSS